jgi:hypothetical protein
MAKHDDAAAGTVNIDRALKAYALAPLAALLLPFYWLYEGRASHRSVVDLPVRYVVAQKTK